MYASLVARYLEGDVMLRCSVGLKVQVSGDMQKSELHKQQSHHRYCKDPQKRPFLSTKSSHQLGRRGPQNVFALSRYSLANTVFNGRKPIKAIFAFCCTSAFRAQRSQQLASSDPKCRLSGDSPVVFCAWQ